MNSGFLTRQNLAAWIMASGIVFGLAMFLTAVFNANPWNDHTYSKAAPIVAGMASPHRDGRDEMVCSSCHIVVPAKMAVGPRSWVLPILKGTRAPHSDGRERMTCSACHTILVRDRSGFKVDTPLQSATGPGSGGGTAPRTNPGAAPPKVVTVAIPPDLSGPPPAEILSPEAHEWYVATRFQGTVRRVAGTGTTTVWGDIYVLVDDGINPSGWLDLAPRLFLEAEGCFFRPGLFVKGTAYRDPGAGPGGLGYVKSIMVNGELCALRDSHLNGLWEEMGGADVEER
jgi:hypothetical protein